MKIKEAPRTRCRECGYMTRHVDTALCSDCQDLEGMKIVGDKLLHADGTPVAGVVSIKYEGSN